MDFEIREDRRPQGPRKLLKERELYLALVDQGMGNTRASRIVGVHPRTGREWRHGRPDWIQEWSQALGVRVCDARVAADLTQEELAHLADATVSTVGSVRSSAQLPIKEEHLMSAVVVSAEAVEEVRPVELAPDRLDEQLIGQLVDRARVGGLQLTGEGGLLLLPSMAPEL